MGTYRILLRHIRPTCREPTATSASNLAPLNDPKQSRNAERARSKRTGETGGNSRRPAPTHPFNMPRTTRHVSTLARLSAPKSNESGEGWELTLYSPAPVQRAKAAPPVSNLAPLSTLKSSAWERELTHYSRATVRHADRHTPSQQSRHAQRAQIKRMGKTTHVLLPRTRPKCQGAITASAL